MYPLKLTQKLNDGPKNIKQIKNFTKEKRKNKELTKKEEAEGERTLVGLDKLLGVWCYLVWFEPY